MNARRCDESELGKYVKSNAGHYHPNLVFKSSDSGQSIITTTALPPHTIISSCPFSIIISPLSVRSALPSLSPLISSDHAIVIVYLMLHSMLLESSTRKDNLKMQLSHYPYINALPSHDQMRTTLYYTEAERELLRGTNLYGATKAREEGWKNEFDQTIAILETWGELRDDMPCFTWGLFLYYSTILSSRAFPSSLIPGYVPSPLPLNTNTIDPEASSADPVLCPGLDMFNHGYSQPVSWVSTGYLSAQPNIVVNASEKGEIGGGGSISLQIDSAIEAGDEVYNNYGPKINEELLLGYGFMLSPNLSELVALKLSLAPFISASTSSLAYSATKTSEGTELEEILRRYGVEDLLHFVPRSGVIPEKLLEQMRLLFAHKAWRSSRSQSEEGREDEEEEEEEEEEDFSYLFEVPSRTAPTRPDSDQMDEDLKPPSLAFLSHLNELSILDELSMMVENKLEMIMTRGNTDMEGTAVARVADTVRTDVVRDIEGYRVGQIEILQATMVHLDSLMESATLKAKEDGVIFDEEDDDDDVEEDEEEEESEQE